MSKLSISHLPVAGLKPYPGNARTHSAKQITEIATSISAFGFNNPVLIDKDGGIIAGHGRVAAAKKLGLETVPCVRLEHANDGAIHFVCMDWRHVGEVIVAATPIYTELKNICVWAKTNGGMGSLYRSQHELVFVLKSGRAPHINNVELGRHGRYSSMNDTRMPRCHSPRLSSTVGSIVRSTMQSKLASLIARPCAKVSRMQMAISSRSRYGCRRTARKSCCIN